MLRYIMDYIVLGVDSGLSHVKKQRGRYVVRFRASLRHVLGRRQLAAGWRGEIAV